MFSLASSFRRCIAIDGWSTLEAGGAGILHLNIYFRLGFFKLMVLIACLLMLKPSAHLFFQGLY